VTTPDADIYTVIHLSSGQSLTVPGASPPTQQADRFLLFTGQDRGVTRLAYVLAVIEIWLWPRISYITRSRTPSLRREAAAPDV